MRERETERGRERQRGGRERQRGGRESDLQNTNRHKIKQSNRHITLKKNNDM